MNFQQKTGSHPNKEVDKKYPNGGPKGQSPGKIYPIISPSPKRPSSIATKSVRMPLAGESINQTSDAPEPHTAIRIMTIKRSQN